MIMIAVSILISMVLCLLFGVPYIDFLKKKMIMRERHRYIDEQKSTGTGY